MALHGSGQRHLLGGHDGGSAGPGEDILLRPIGSRNIWHLRAKHSLSRRIVDKEPIVLVGDDHGIHQIAEHRSKDLLFFPQGLLRLLPDLDVDFQ